MLNYSLITNIKNRINKKFGKKMVAIYDLDKINCSHDFLVFFQNAYFIKKTKKMKTLDIIILSGSFSGFKKQQFNREKSFKLEYAKSRLANIIFPSLSMFSDYYDNFFFIKNRKDLDFSNIKKNYQLIFPQKYFLSINKEKYVKECIWANLEKNHQTFKFIPLKTSKILENKISKYLNTKKKIISITLRESGYTVYRNSKNNEWKKLIQSFDKKKIKTLVIRDFENMGKKDFFRDYEIFPDASYNLFLRTALYNICDLNMFVDGGPQTICWINNYKSISWKIWGDGKHKSLYDDNIGFSKNEKSKILNNKRQILLSDNDTFDNLIKYKKYFKI